MDASPHEPVREAPTSPQQEPWDAFDQSGNQPGRFGLPTKLWWVWASVLLLLPGSVGMWAIAELLGLPDLPNCWMVSQRSVPSVRLYCAEVFADKGTIDLLGRAIDLASALPDPALAPRGDKLALQWAQAMLQVADSKFQQGELEEALTIANKIPTTLQTQSLINDRTREWKAIWAKAEEIYSDALLEIDQQNWFGTISTARQLFIVGNKFWASTKYQELMEKLQAAKEENQWQQRAASSRSVSPSSSVDNLMAQWEKEQEQSSRNRLQTAQTLARSGNAQGLAAAVNEAESVLYGSTHYDEAQRLIDSWNAQIEVIEDRPRLDRAIALANQGGEDSLRAAISEARQIYWGRALYNEANTRVEEWNKQLYQTQVEADVNQLPDPNTLPTELTQPLPDPLLEPTPENEFSPTSTPSPLIPPPIQ